MDSPRINQDADNLRLEVVAAEHEILPMGLPFRTSLELRTGSECRVPSQSMADFRAWHGLGNE
jgi:hypothetical protein